MLGKVKQYINNSIFTKSNGVPNKRVHVFYPYFSTKTLLPNIFWTFTTPIRYIAMSADKQPVLKDQKEKDSGSPFVMNKQQGRELEF